MDIIEQPAQPVRYVTYQPDGTLDGCYLQVPGEDHLTRMIIIDEAQAAAWVTFRANEARDGVELAPPTAPADPALVVPQSVAMWQARAILIEDDMLDDVSALLEAISDEKARKLALAKFEYSSTVRRDDPLVTQVIPQLGKTEAQIDEMFIRAAAL
jgi:hypothetical protein